ncbi:sigma-70 family RNA polymerase sigma factor [Maribacter sp.]|uniref:RNA polymerase sigma factor n=1 Tax=Maribacter sp. TaxID=1897614 RepID=UPI0025C51FB3|nr:sigma-70 family RNA polymerase sigma factor [Maribacter sp.]
MEISPEKSLWFMFIKGDLNAFSSLFKHFYPMLHGYGMKISGNTELTEDCLQSFFIYLHDNKDKIGEVTHVKSYLFISYRRALLKVLKKERLYSTFNETMENNMGFVFSKEELSSKQETIKLKSTALIKILNSLSTREKEAIYLKYYSNLKTQEISEIMGISYQSVQNTLQKAFTKLRDKSESDALHHILQNS